MKIQLKKYLIMVVTLFATISASAYDFMVDGICYNILSEEDKTVEVTEKKTSSYEGTVSIPSDVTYDGSNYSVVEIGHAAFYGDDKLTSVKIPDGVVKIGSQAFLYSSLASVELPETIVEIGHTAFGGTKIKTVSIPYNVISIGGGAFRDCVELTSVTLGDGLSEIGLYMFEGCVSLESIDIPDNITCIWNGAFSGCRNLVSVENGNRVDDIRESAFKGCSSLTSIRVPTTLRSGAFQGCRSLKTVEFTNIGWGVIDDFVFVDCDSLATIKVSSANPAFASVDGVLYDKAKTSLILCPPGADYEVEIPEGVTTIRNYGFYGCGKLPSVKIPESVTAIGDYAFACCGSLGSVNVPNSVTSLGKLAFTDCVSIKDAKIGDGVTKMGRFLFAGCDALESVEIGNSVDSISEWAFSGCDNLASIKFGEKVKAIDNYAFIWCGSLPSIEIPDGVTSLGEELFSWCTSLTSVTLGKDVAELGRWAFNGCERLEKIQSNSTTPPVAPDDIFINQSQPVTLYVPGGTKPDYESVSPWNALTIVETSEGAEKSPAGVGELSAEVNVRVECGEIVVTGVDAVEVYSMDGRKVYCGEAGRIAVAGRGIYLVVAGSTVTKVAL